MKESNNNNQSWNKKQSYTSRSRIPSLWRPDMIMCMNCDMLLSAVCSEGKVTRCGVGRKKFQSDTPLNNLENFVQPQTGRPRIWNKRVPNSLRHLTYVNSVVINLCAHTLAAEILWNHMHVRKLSVIPEVWWQWQTFCFGVRGSHGGKFPVYCHLEYDTYCRLTHVQSTSAK
jgi:hypothetical protein